jgi:hypothetical protein
MAYEQHVGGLAPPPLRVVALKTHRYRRRGGSFHDFVTQSLTFEVSIDACEWESSVPQLENDVRAS